MAAGGWRPVAAARGWAPAPARPRGAGRWALLAPPPGAGLPVASPRAGDLGPRPRPRGAAGVELLLAASEQAWPQRGDGRAPQARRTEGCSGRRRSASVPNRCRRRRHAPVWRQGSQPAAVPRSRCWLRAGIGSSGSAVSQLPSQQSGTESARALPRALMLRPRYMRPGHRFVTFDRLPRVGSGP